MLPTPKKDWILDNKCKSLPCNSIEKIGVTLHLIALFSLLVIEIMKEPSAPLLPLLPLLHLLVISQMQQWRCGQKWRCGKKLRCGQESVKPVIQFGFNGKFINVVKEILI